MLKNSYTCARSKTMISRTVKTLTIESVILLAVLSLVDFRSVVISSNENLEFSRPTVKGRVLEQEPKWQRRTHRDEHYEFLYRGFRNEHDDSALFAHDRVRDRWLEITDLSTENARLGKSFDIPAKAGADFRGLANLEYAHLPLKAGKTIIFPDRITFNSNIGLYRMDFNSQLNLPISLTSFWVRKSDLDAIR